MHHQYIRKFNACPWLISTDSKLVLIAIASCYKGIGCQAYNPEYNLSIRVHSKLTTCGDLYSDTVRLNLTTQAVYHSSIDIQGGSK